MIVNLSFTELGRKHLWKPALDMYFELLQMLEANYPETLKNAIVINGNQTFWNLISICLHLSNHAYALNRVLFC